LSAAHIIAALARAVRAAGGNRHTLSVADNEPQRAALVRPAADRGVPGH
jgi:hypothetical protein